MSGVQTAFEQVSRHMSNDAQAELRKALRTQARKERDALGTPRGRLDAGDRAHRARKLAWIHDLEGTAESLKERATREARARPKATLTNPGGGGQ